MRKTWLIVALGSIGRRHALNLRQLRRGDRIVALRSGRSGAPSPADGVVDAEVYDMEAALAEKPVAAIICSPAPFHLTAARQLAAAGVNLFIEKPISTHSNGVGALIQQCARKNLVLMVGYNLRFHDTLVRLREILDAGEIGDCLHVRCEVGQYLPDWRPDSDFRTGVSARRDLGGGVCLELSHEFDYLRWIFGDVNGVFASARQSGRLEVDVEDCVDCLCEMHSGVIASVHMDFLQRKAVRRCRVVGSQAALDVDILAGKIIRNEGQGAVSLHQASTERNNTYLKEMKNFVDCVFAEDVPRCSGEDGLQVLRIVDAVKDSSRTRTFVKLAEPRDGV